MPATDYPRKLRIADYFSKDVQSSVLISINHLPGRGTEQSALYPAPKICFMLPNRFKSKSITLACVTFLVHNELNPNHLALIAEIACQSRKRHLNKLLIVLFAHVGVLFPSGIVAYNQRSYTVPYKCIDNLTANLLKGILKIAVSFVVHASDSSCRSLYALQTLDRLQVRECFIKVVIVRFEIFAAINRAAFRSRVSNLLYSFLSRKYVSAFHHRVWF